jgi:hypothetical protein
MRKALIFGIICTGIFFLTLYISSYNNFTVTPSKKLQDPENTRVEPSPSLLIDKKTGLTTYISNKGKFQISYPSDLIIHVDFVRVQNTDRYHYVANEIELDSPKLKKAPYVLVQYGENFTHETVREYVLNSSECEDVEDKEGQTITVSGVEAILYENITCSSRGETRIYFVKGTMEYNIIISGANVDKTFQKILLDNFKFI